MMRIGVVCWLLLLLVGCLPSPQRRRSPSASDTATAIPRLDPQAVQAITFEDLDLPLEPDSVFQENILTQRVRDLAGKRVRIQGFMGAGSVFTTRNVKRFVLLREKECPYGPGGQAHHAIAVELEGVVAQFSTAPLTVEGVLTIEPFTGENGKTWSVYRLVGTRVER